MMQVQCQKTSTGDRLTPLLLPQAGERDRDRDWFGFMWNMPAAPPLPACRSSMERLTPPLPAALQYFL